MKSLIFHGTFESGRDWEPYRNAWDAEVVDLWDFMARNPVTSWESFVAQFKKEFPVCDYDCLVGYSLGGRALLHLLGAEWRPRKRAVFFSTHPGLSSEQERISRLWMDLQWKEKTLALAWHDLHREWNAQAVFVNDPLNPYENFAAIEPRRAEIAQAFDIFSSGRSGSFVSQLARESRELELHWVTGARDLKYAKLSEELARSVPALKFTSLAGAGHRVHKYSAPALIEASLHSFFRP